MDSTTVVECCDISNRQTSDKLKVNSELISGETQETVALWCCQGMVWFHLSSSCPLQSHKLNKLTQVICTTLEPLTGDVNNLYHLPSMQCSAGKSWVLEFIWMLLDPYHPSKHHCGPCIPPHPNATELPDGLQQICRLIKSINQGPLKLLWGLIVVQHLPKTLNVGFSLVTHLYLPHSF